MSVASSGERFTNALNRFAEQHPVFVKAMILDENGGNFFTLKLQFCSPFDEIAVHFDETYRSHYPQGTVTFIITERTSNKNNTNNNGSNTIVRSMPAASSPTFERIAVAISDMAKAAGADGETFYAMKKKIQDDVVVKTNSSASSPVTTSTATATNASTAGKSIEELFPMSSPDSDHTFSNHHHQDQHEEQDEDDADDFFPRTKSNNNNQHLLSGMSGMTRSQSNLLNNNNMGQRSSSRLMGHYNAAAGRATTANFMWTAAPTVDVDPALEAVKSNNRLLDDIARLEGMLDGGSDFGPNSISVPVMNSIRSTETGSISLTVSFSPVDLCERIMRQYLQNHLYSLTSSPEEKAKTANNVDNASMSKKLLNNYYSNITVKSLFTLLESLEISKSERFIFRFEVDPSLYPLGSRKVEFGQSGNFQSGVFPGAIGQIRRILATYLSSEQRLMEETENLPSTTTTGLSFASLVRSGYPQEDISAVLLQEGVNGDFSKVKQILDKEFLPKKQKASEGDDEHQELLLRKQFPPTEVVGLFVGAVAVFANRLKTLTKECCICGRPHIFTNGNAASSSSSSSSASSSSSTQGQMCGISICTRGSCQFRFSKLNVARDVATSSALQTGVIDLLLMLARFAAHSERWELVFDPFPTLLDPQTGKITCSPTEKNIDLCRTILKQFPLMKNLATSETQSAVQEALLKHHALAPAMFNFVISSNRSILIKLPVENLVPFMKCRHQFRLIMQNAEREEKFQQLKKEHSARWVFHGSSVKNWYSIMRNGLKNASGTALLVNGAAYGSGIYLSPCTSVSASYAEMYKYENSIYDSPDMTKHFEHEYLEPGENIDEEPQVKAIAICEVVNKDLRMNDDIWVQPHEECVVTRFLFVYTHLHECPSDLDLKVQSNQDVLNKVLDSV